MDPDWDSFRPFTEVLTDLDAASHERLAEVVRSLPSQGNVAVQVASNDGKRRMQVSMRRGGSGGADSRERAMAVITDVT